MGDEVRGKDMEASLRLLDLDQKKICTFCGKSGKIVDLCFCKHGYPSGLRPRDLPSMHNVIGAYCDDEDDKDCDDKK